MNQLIDRSINGLFDFAAQALIKI